MRLIVLNQKKVRGENMDYNSILEMDNITLQDCTDMYRLKDMCAVIDNSYSGDSDEWKLPVIAMEDTTINKNDRICQFRINEIQPNIEFEEVEHLDNVSRGGFGSTGK